LRLFEKLFHGTILYTYGLINVAYKASLACFLGVFALFLGVFSVTLAPVFDLYLACPFLSSLATVRPLFDYLIAC
jgi:hypothetical protein